MYPGCDREARLFFLNGPEIKDYFCAEHYDEMAAFYKRDESSFGKDMVERNGWR